MKNHTITFKLDASQALKDLESVKDAAGNLCAALSYKKGYKNGIIGISMAAMRLMAADAKAQMVTINKPPGHGPTETITGGKLDEMREALEAMAANSDAAKEAAFKLGEIGDIIQFDKPKRIHPKHQKSNKYRKFK